MTTHSRARIALLLRLGGEAVNTHPTIERTAENKIILNVPELWAAVELTREEALALSSQIAQALYGHSIAYGLYTSTTTTEAKP